MANRVHALRTLADMLEEYDRGFKMSDWMRVNYYDPISVEDGFVLKSGLSPTLCGTTLCAAGFATLNAGWEIKYQVGPTNQVIDVEYRFPGEVWSQERPDWAGEGQDYLGIDDLTAKVLFYSTGDGGKQAVEIMTRLAMGDDPSEFELFDYAEILDIDVDDYQ